MSMKSLLKIANFLRVDRAKIRKIPSLRRNDLTVGMQYYLISDLDHTLLNEQGRLSQRTIHAVVSSGLSLMLDSARMPAQMLDVINQLQLKGPQTALNGAVVFQPNQDKFEILNQHAIPDPAAQKVQELIESVFPQLNLTWMDAFAWHVSTYDQGVANEIFYTGIKPIYDVHNRPIQNALQMLLIIEDPILLKKVKSAILSLQSAEIAVHEAGDGYLTINAASADKSQAAHYLINHGLASYGQLMAFGDDENDLPLLKSVAHPVAMANASQNVKESAEIIALSNEKDGIAQIIERIAPNKDQVRYT